MEFLFVFLFMILQEYISKSEEYKQLIKEIIESANYETENENEIELKDLTKENVDNKHDKLICLEEIHKKKKISKSIFISLKYPSLRYKFLILCILWFGTREKHLTV